MMNKLLCAKLTFCCRQIYQVIARNSVSLVHNSCIQLFNICNFCLDFLQKEISANTEHKILLKVAGVLFDMYSKTNGFLRTIFLFKCREGKRD
jgi:hypothetical protein